MLICAIPGLRAYIAMVALNVASVVDLARPSSAADYYSTVAEVTSLSQVRPDFLLPDDPNLLFYIQHSSSPNTVVYAAHINPNGRFDGEQPIDVYWKRFADDGARASLSLVERFFGYGIHILKRSSDGNSVAANIVSYPERVITVDFDDDNKPRASTEMGGRRTKLVYVYLDVDESGFIPSVMHVDVFGVEITNGHVLHEVIRPLSAPKY